MNRPQQYCTFYLDGLFFGIDVQMVQEVIRRQEASRVPLAPRSVTGLINLRGQIVTAIDLRRRLGMVDRPADRDPMNVVVRGHDGAVSLLVDEIGDVLEVEEDEIQAPPSTLHGTSRDLIHGIFKLESRLLLLLDIEQMLGIDAAACMATTAKGSA